MCRTYNQYLKELLETFLQHCYQLYGVDMAVYNVDSLIHLTEQALDNIFPSLLIMIYRNLNGLCENRNSPWNKLFVDLKNRQISIKRIIPAHHCTSSIQEDLFYLNLLDQHRVTKGQDKKF